MTTKGQNGMTGEQRYTYQSALEASERINWRVEDLIGGDKRLDFGRPFMPESLARAGKLDFLSPREQQTLNQIRGHGYLHTFGLVEEFILPFVLDHARSQLHGDSYVVRALLEFAAEEAKHIHLFRRFGEDFVRGFGTRVDGIGPAPDVAKAVLSHHPLGVALVILHIEWMTQRHWIEAVRDDQGLDPQFTSLLKHHWMEEAQHAKLDTLMVDALAKAAPGEIERGLEDYQKLGGIIDGALGQQVEMDLDALTRATGRALTEDEQAACRETQRQALRWTYLGSGMSHPRFLETVGRLSPAARQSLEAMAPALS